MLIHYSINSTDNQKNQLLELVYSKWESFFEMLFNDDDFYSNKLILTDYCEFIVKYFIELKSVMEIEESITDLLDKISNINCIWFKNNVNQITHFYVYLSKLHLLSYAFDIKQINNSTSKMNYENIKSDAIMLSRFDRDNNLENYLNLIHENLS